MDDDRLLNESWFIHFESLLELDYLGKQTAKKI